MNNVFRKLLTIKYRSDKITLLANGVIFSCRKAFYLRMMPSADSWDDRRAGKERETAMKPEKNNTLDRILSSAKQEFLEKGFQNASLRNIVKNAGVTTGAFYRYYDSKEELFSALAGEQAEYMLSLFEDTLEDFKKLPGDVQTEQMTDVSSACIAKMMDYIYDNYDAFKLLIECAEGTSYGDFIHQLVVKEVESTYTYMETLSSEGHPVGRINKNLVHMISSGLLTGMFEAVVHDMEKAEADEYVSQLSRFYTAGWSELLGVKFGK